LWQASDARLPSGRAEPLALWLRHFEMSRRFVAVVVADRDQWLAALPLVVDRVGGWFRLGRLPFNHWLVCGDLLVAAHADRPQVIAALAAGVDQLALHALQLDWVNTDAAGWDALVAQWQNEERPQYMTPQFSVGVIDTVGDWSAYEQRLSKNLRRALKRGMGCLAKSGDVVFRRIDGRDRNELRVELERAFDLEDKTWKGEAGTSVRRTPGLAEFYCELAEVLAHDQLFELQVLEAGGRLAAFEYGLVGKGTFASLKVGYEPEFAAAGPGQLLVQRQLEQAFADQSRREIDTLGILSDATRRWATSTYTRSRLLVAGQRTTGRWMVSAVKRYLPQWKRWRGVPASEAPVISLPVAVSVPAATSGDIASV